MSAYTIELGELMEAGYQLDLQTYPIFAEEYRAALNKKIIDHFWFREIGQETPDRFNRMLGRKMREIMPYYNQRYLSTMIQFDPLAADYWQQQQQDNRRQQSNSADTGSTVRQASEDAVTALKRAGWDFTEGTGSHTEGVTGSYQKDGHRDTESDENQTVDTNTHTTGNELRTDNLSQQTTNTTATDSTRTDNLTEEQSRDQTRTGQETNTGKETVLDTIDTGQTVTNNLQKNQTGNTTTTGSRTETGATSSVFSETPQNALSVTLTMNQDGTSTTNASNYATTLTQNNERKSASDQETSENTATTKDTGTVTTDGNSTENRTVDTTNKKEYTETVTEDGLKKNTGTVETAGTETLNGKIQNTGTVNTDTTSDQTQNTVTHTHMEGQEDWTEQGSDKRDTEYHEQNTLNQKDESTEDAENTLRRKESDIINQFRSSLSDTHNAAEVWQKGRRGLDPSQLLASFRETFLNVDMEIISELETLFMGIW